MVAATWNRHIDVRNSANGSQPVRADKTGLQGIAGKRPSVAVVRDIVGHSDIGMGTSAGEKAMSQADTNIAAFLSTIAHAEGTDRSPDSYRCCYGYEHTVIDMRDHPAITGEWRGKKLPDRMCKAVGLKPGCISTAAGRYQMIRPTWRAMRDELQLPDFGPASQDKAALRLIAQSGALQDVKDGRIVAAIGKVRKQWASMPGAGVGQPERKLADLLKYYASKGGVVQ
jgi:lysozyme